MVIIPLGSTEQHGPHMPLGTDTYEALDMAKMISQRTGVVVAPVLWVGYSVYHAGFPGTLSLNTETMEQVLFETAEMLIRHGFRRFMFFNYHGGNNVVQEKVIHRINHTTEAAGVAIGHGSPMQVRKDGEFFDWHAGLNETSIMLYLRPDLVRKERIEKPVITFTEKQQELINMASNNPDLPDIAGLYLGVPEETGKEGASHELSSNGIWSLSDVKNANRELGKNTVETMVDNAVRFIEAWKQAHP
jgi:creatinine amidohydrolase